jgi:hypothetical protein
VKKEEKLTNFPEMNDHLKILFHKFSHSHQFASGFRTSQKKKLKLKIYTIKERRKRILNLDAKKILKRFFHIAIVERKKIAKSEII